MADQTEMFEKLAIREQIENWVIFRDSGKWDLFESVWHEDGYMMATWFQGPAADFIEHSRNGFERGTSTILHFLGGTSIDISDTRAVAQTKMTISQRAKVDGVLCDVVCTGRFYDFLEHREGRWGIVLRQPIYEKDRLEAVDPAVRVELDSELLAQFPAGYKHLAYLQTGLGFTVKPDMPGLTGPQVEALYGCGKAWLKGELSHPRETYESQQRRRRGDSSFGGTAIAAVTAE